MYLIRDGERLPVRRARDRRDIDKLLPEYGIDPRVVAWVGESATAKRPECSSMNAMAVAGSSSTAKYALAA